jgi:hypothetical protein
MAQREALERQIDQTKKQERGEAIEKVRLIGGRLVLQYLVDVQSRLSLVGLDGSAQGDVALPGTGTVTDLGGRQDEQEIFYAFSSPLFPTSVFSYDPASKKGTPFEAAKPPVDVSHARRDSSSPSQGRDSRAVFPDGTEEPGARRQSSRCYAATAAFRSARCRLTGPTCLPGWSWAASG